MPEQNPIKRAIRKPTYLNAIKAMCAACMGCTLDHIEGGFREEIRDCTAPACPLFPFRPYRADKRAVKVQESTLEANPCQSLPEPINHADIPLEVGLQGVCNA